MSNTINDILGHDCDGGELIQRRHVWMLFQRRHDEMNRARSLKRLGSGYYIQAVIEAMKHQDAIMSSFECDPDVAERVRLVSSRFKETQRNRSL